MLTQRELLCGYLRNFLKVCCIKQRGDYPPLPAIVRGMPAPAISESPVVKFCNGCGKKLSVVPRGTANGRTFYLVMPCSCG